MSGYDFPAIYDNNSTYMVSKNVLVCSTYLQEPTTTIPNLTSNIIIVLITIIFVDIVALNAVYRAVVIVALLVLVIVANVSSA